MLDHTPTHPAYHPTAPRARGRWPAGLTVRPVRNGLGIVAVREFAAGEAICTIHGARVGLDEMARFWNEEPRRAENCFRFAADHYLDPEGEIGAYANHSCRPNAGVVRTPGRLALQAIAPIGAGEEVTHDYATLLGADDEWQMECNCGEACCRERVASFTTLPPALLRRYRALGIIPRFILATARD